MSAGREFRGHSSDRRFEAPQPLDTSHVFPPTVAQVQRALDTLHNNTRSGHGNLYSQECGRSRVSDPINFPLGRSTAKEFGKIIQAAAFVEMASDRVRFKQAVAAGWAEARCPSQPKFQQSLVFGPVALSICLDTRTGCER